VDPRRLESAVRPVAETAGAGHAAADLARYLALLADANQRVNLVSRRAVEDDLCAHVADSLAGLPLLPPPGSPLRLLDVGSGGGFPAIPILLCRRDIEAVLAESTAKKAAFLSAACAELHLTAEVVNARFPDSFPKKMPPFNVLTSRAVADPLGLAVAARPFMARGARALFWTTRGVLEDAAARVPHEFVPLAGTEQKGIAVVECFT